MASAPELLHFLEKRWGISIQNPPLLQDAVVHSSIQKGEFQRLEFLGDRVLGLVISTWLYHLRPQEEEGALAKRFSALVSRTTLYQVACALELQKKICVEVAAGPPPMRILADACEALIGAIYLDQGLEKVSRIIRKEWEPFLQLHVPPPVDPKSALQEYLQNLRLPTPTYTVLCQEGPSHLPVFTVQVILHHQPTVCFQATGHSKRQAQQKVAQKALDYLTGEIS